ncbi:MAG TPA: zinc-binding alcohol dehydrogenase family protein [Terracidiphilus sp.]|jgi:NADPH2:quinone reductase|nr:zinc-binding alcohol dehydrogenase family protein [Terracidiphilus sp.]
MHAAVVNSLGEPPKYQSFPDPVPQDGEVLVHVRAAGLHPVVKGLASGSHYASGGQLPAVPGLDGVGALADGSRVYFVFVRKPWGTMAERAAAPRSKCIPVPDGLGDMQAAAIANPGMSAWLSMKTRAGVVAGETVLILGATGVAGQLAIQAARLLGAKRVIAAGRNIAALASADVDAVIALGDSDDAVREAFTAQAAAGIDVIIDYLWGRPTELLLEALAKGFKASSTHRTRLVEVGSSAGPTITLPGATLRSIDLTLLGSGFGAASLEEIFAVIPTLFSMAAQGKLTIAVEPIPLADVESAWTRTEKGRRIIFTP